MGTREIWCYVAHLGCGCAVALVVDCRDRFTAREVSTFIKRGYRVERQLVDSLYGEDGKLRLGCKCAPKAEVQGRLIDG